MILTKRSSGVLCHLTSLASEYGIGDMGPSARVFIDFLAGSDQSYWQILPLNPTDASFDHSPYMSCAALAGNPLLISPEVLIREGLLDAKDLPVPRFSEYTVQYDKIVPYKQKLLASAIAGFDLADAEFLDFCAHCGWLDDYALFMALKEEYKGKPWYDWPREVARRDPATLDQLGEKLASRLTYYHVEQYLFSRQWQRLRDYAKESGISIIGDLPIYVAHDSVDVWANQRIFQLNQGSGRSSYVAGVPPDYFSETGQRWGNPLYRWKSRTSEVRQDLLAWWEQRLKSCFAMVDIIRIDHFRGFESYWSIPAKEKTAINGRWIKGPGLSFFHEMEKRLGPLRVIAEDLGVITPEVEALRRELDFPGMKILLFAFGDGPDNAYLPHNYEDSNSVVYTGTHDNDTAVGWYLNESVPQKARDEVKLYANRAINDENTSIHHDLIYLALSSIARLAVIPLQDVLGFGNDCRMNTPATREGNWRWRYADHFLRPETAAWLREHTQLFGRAPIKSKPELVEEENDESTADPR